MWKKFLIAGASVICLASVGFFGLNKTISAATNLNVLLEGDQVIVGTGNDGSELTWKVSKDNGSYYAMFIKWSGQVCNSSTDNFTDPHSNHVPGCHYRAAASGKSDSLLYTYTKAFDNVFSASLTANTFENSAIQSITEATATLTHVYTPTSSDMISGKIGSAVLPPDFTLSDVVYLRARGAWFNAAYIKDNPIAEMYSSSSSGGTLYPKYISYHWQFTQYGWLKPNSIIVSHLENSNILYVLNTDIHKNTLTSDPRSGVLKIRYADPAY